MTQNSSSYLIDSDLLVALYRDEDSNHQKSLEIFAQLETENIEIIVTNFVISETATVLSAKNGQVTSCQFLEDVAQSGIHIFHISEKIQAKTFELFKQQKKKHTSMVDCSNVAVAQAMEIPQILSFDKFYRKFNLQSNF